MNQSTDRLSVQEIVARIHQGPEVFNSWRRQHPEAVIDLTGIKLHELDLSGINLCDAILSDGQLLRVKLDDAKFSRADLRQAQLHGCSCIRTWFDRADLQLAQLWGCNLDSAILSGANFVKTIFTNSDLLECTLTDTVLSNLDLSGIDLSYADLRRANLYRTEVYGANLRHAKLAGADISGCKLWEANLDRASGLRWRTRLWVIGKLLRSWAMPPEPKEPDEET